LPCFAPLTSTYLPESTNSVSYQSATATGADVFVCASISSLASAFLKCFSNFASALYIGRDADIFILINYFIFIVNCCNFLHIIVVYFSLWHQIDTKIAIDTIFLRLTLNNKSPYSLGGMGTFSWLRRQDLNLWPQGYEFQVEVVVPCSILLNLSILCGF
jgi:hypothetical protein